MTVGSGREGPGIESWSLGLYPDRILEALSLYSCIACEYMDCTGIFWYFVSSQATWLNDDTCLIPCAGSLPHDPSQWMIYLELMFDMICTRFQTHWRPSVSGRQFVRCYETGFGQRLVPLSSTLSGRELKYYRCRKVWSREVILATFQRRFVPFPWKWLDDRRQWTRAARNRHGNIVYLYTTSFES